LTDEQRRSTRAARRHPEHDDLTRDALTQASDGIMKDARRADAERADTAIAIHEAEARAWDQAHRTAATWLDSLADDAWWIIAAGGLSASHRPPEPIPGAFWA
jgi:hypothetical protein